MFQGPKGYVAQMCYISTPGVWKQYNKMAVLICFWLKFTHRQSNQAFFMTVYKNGFKQHLENFLVIS